MRSIATATALVLAALTTAPGLAGEDAAAGPDGARALILEALGSMGGREAVAEIDGLSAAYEGDYAGEEMSSPYRAKTLWTRAGAFRWDLDAGEFTGSMGVTSGGSPWSAFMAPPARVRGPVAKVLDGWLDQWDLFLLEPLLAREDVKLYRGEEGMRVVVEIEGGDRYELGFARSDGDTFLASMAGPMTHMDGRIGRFEADWSEPKESGGITMPSVTIFRTYLDDELSETLEERVVSVEWNPELEDDAFAVPEPEMEFGKPAVRELPERTVLSVVHEGAYDTMSETMGRLSSVLAANGLMPAGGMIAIFAQDPATVPDPADLRTEIVLPIVPVDPAPELPEGIRFRELPAMKVVSLFLRGEYGTKEAEGIGMAAAFMGKNGHAFGGPPRVVYHHDPASTVPEDQIAEIRVPIAP